MGGAVGPTLGKLDLHVMCGEKRSAACSVQERQLHDDAASGLVAIPGGQAGAGLVEEGPRDSESHGTR